MKAFWMSLKVRCVCLMMFAAALAGCGSSENLVKVSGKVSADGKPVTGGTLIIAPAGTGKNPGTPAALQIKEDGTFESRAVVPGKCTVLFNPPATLFPVDYQPKPNETPAPSPFNGLVPESKDIEVKANTTLEIKLVRKK